ncbi:hypothetical protein [uncultured Hydrogenophaga sp.]|uniref:hypothetical protein n=1 Tax=uncultured Hydrogenophaga sp. TaxID=199683 RepID=UPI00258DC1F3|nr:hypothetical protein [uncultured Hydrogenophaga sp.]
MSVRTSLRQPGHQTASAKFEKQPLDTQQNGVSTKPSFVVKTDPSITAVKAFIGFLFGFPPFDAPPEPLFPTSQGPSHSSHGIVVKFTTTEREHETALVMHTLLTLFYFDGPFVLHFTERAQPPARPLPSTSRPTIEQSAPRKTAHSADSDLSWHHLPSRAGQEASGVPLFPRQSIDDELKKLRKERLATTETVEAPTPEHLAEETGFQAEHRREAPHDTVAAAVPYDFQAYQAALNEPPVDTVAEGYRQEVERLKARVAASTDGTPSAIEDAWHRQYLEELRNPKVAVSAPTEPVPEPSQTEWQRQNLNVEPAPGAPEAPAAA